MKKCFLLSALVLALFALCFVGCDDGGGGDGDKDGFTLTVTGLESAPTGLIWGASLLGQTGDPVAIGMEAANGTFAFYNPSSGGPLPFDPDSPFNTPGTYGLGIATSTISGEPDTIYVYTGGTPQGTVTYGTNKSVTVNRSEFSEMGGQPTNQSTVITITNKPANTQILAVMDGDTQIALALALSGNEFTLFEPGAMGPSTTPWKGTGNYTIILINMMTQQPVASYMKMEEGTPVMTYSFTGQEAIAFDYTTDFVELLRN